MTTTILVGDVRAKLAELPAASVHCVVCSPPYWGLRTYGTPPQVWGGDPGCEHAFLSETVATEIGGGNWSQARNGRGEVQGEVAEFREPMRSQTKRGFCSRCGAWRGELGLEPDWRLYIEHIVAVFAEVWRVLRRDGTVWLNLGDSYATGAGNVGASPGGGEQGERWKGNRGVHKPEQSGKAAPRIAAMGPMTQPNRMPQAGLKPKDLVMMPARVAIALQEWGWWVRSEIVWAKTSPMPESVTDRPTSATEKVFLLSKSATYFYDAEAVKERSVSDHPSGNGFRRDPRLSYRDADGARGNDKPWDDVGGTRNLRNFWLLGPEPFPEAHFATYVTEVPRRAILAGTSAKGVCQRCGAPWVRQVERTFRPQADVSAENGIRGALRQKPMDASSGWDGVARGSTETATIGWAASCGCDAGAPAPATVLDPFLGSGTTALVADRLGRDCIGIELNPDYAEMARRRVTKEVPLLAYVKSA